MADEKDKKSDNNELKKHILEPGIDAVITFKTSSDTKSESDK
jgi:hypothetical protein